ncbi:MAG TPA: hypothetical protein PK098_12805 [Phycisphaerales bacterium]|nr:hypothetical protein [Phycisphaerales bacterium]
MPTDLKGSVGFFLARFALSHDEESVLTGVMRSVRYHAARPDGWVLTVSRSFKDGVTD